jgi:hypothetical protein
MLDAGYWILDTRYQFAKYGDSIAMEDPNIMVQNFIITDILVTFMFQKKSTKI